MGGASERGKDGGRKTKNETANVTVSEKKKNQEHEAYSKNLTPLRERDGSEYDGGYHIRILHLWPSVEAETVVAVVQVGGNAFVTMGLLYADGGAGGRRL